MKRFALLSVSDRTGLVDLSRSLVRAGFTLLATSGTKKELDGAGIESLSVETYAGQAELLDGRVKTLVPKIHGGILARRDVPSHMSQLEAAEIGPIDMVVVNLYPFTKYVGTERASDPAQMIELIDVGGPTMLRAAAKNHAFVLPVLDPSDYPEVIEALGSGREGAELFSQSLRRRYAAKVFAALHSYDGAIAKYLSSLDEKAQDDQGGLPADVSISLTKKSDLRYGENPHQKAGLYSIASSSLQLASGPTWKQLGGKELSYNNMLDLDAALRLSLDLPSSGAVVAILKHLNPCGVAVDRNLTEAIRRAKLCDPRSHFGGVMVINQEVTREAAEEVREDFAELIIAPRFASDAVDVLRTSKNLRIIEVDPAALGGYDVRTVAGALLVQEPDTTRSAVTKKELVTERTPSDEEMQDIDLAWRIVGHVKSNAIVLVRDGLLLGVGAGQMSRVDSVELAVRKAKLHGHLLEGAVAASDAFFPFPDAVEALAAEGIKCIVSPGGARRDDEVKSTASSRSVSLFFAPDRHFRH